MTSPTDIRKLMESIPTPEPVMESSDHAEELRDIQEQMMDMCRQALQLVRQGGGHYERARSYWYGHIMSALGSDEYPRGGSPTMEDSIEELSGGDMEEIMYMIDDMVSDGMDENEAISAIADKHHIPAQQIADKWFRR